jgi:hypothetical protein
MLMAAKNAKTDHPSWGSVDFSYRLKALADEG